MSGTNQGHAFPAGAQLTAAALCWGLGTVLTKYSLEGIGASVLLPFQLACSAGLLGAVVFATDASPSRIGDRAKVAALGVLNPGIAYALGLVGLARIEASLSVIIWATEPVLIAVLALGVLRERLRLPSLLCLISAMTGVALIVGAPSGGASPVGVILTLAAVSACALYSVLLQRMRLTDGTLPIVFVQQISALGFAIVLLLVSGWDLRGAVDATAWEVIAAIAGGMLYYGVGSLLYVAGLRRTSASQAGLFLTLIPVFGLLFSALLLGETMGAAQTIGAVIVIGSMAVLPTWRVREHSDPWPHVGRGDDRFRTSEPG